MSRAQVVANIVPFEHLLPAPSDEKGSVRRPRRTEGSFVWRVWYYLSKAHVQQKLRITRGSRPP